MSDNFERVQLGAEEEEQVAGGRFTWAYHAEAGEERYHVIDPTTGAEYRFNDSFVKNNKAIIDLKIEEKKCGLSTPALAQKWVNEGKMRKIN